MTHGSLISLIKSMVYVTEQSQRWQRRKKERPSEIIDAALDIFVEHGYAASRLDDIAKKAGISKGSLYRYFDSKADLFKEMVKQVVIPQIEKAETTANDGRNHVHAQH